MVKTTFWPYKGNPYDLFALVNKNSRIPVTQMARILKVNPKTADDWWNAALKKQIIILPRFRRRSYLNFREYVYFLNVKDPYSFYNSCIDDENLLYFSVHIGFSNFEIISKCPIDPEGDILFWGPRTDYYVSVPLDITFSQAGERLLKKLDMINQFEPKDSPLVLHPESYEPWDKKNEEIYEAFRDNLRKPFAKVMRETHTYSDKVMNWIRTREEFGQTITMYFPQGLSAYLPTVYTFDTEYESLLIHLFSGLPTPSVFYKVNDTVIMSLYLPFSLEDRILIRKILSILQKKELVNEYTNSITEYGYRP